MLALVHGYHSRALGKYTWNVCLGGERGPDRLRSLASAINCDRCDRSIASVRHCVYSWWLAPTTYEARALDREGGAQPVVS
jgi:hypothetical protein